MTPPGVILGSMSRAHDIGGQTGFGPVLAGGHGGTSPGGNTAGSGDAVGGDGQPFAADWEARVYALNAVLRRRGVFSTDQMRDAIERIPPREYLAASYYERWLLAMEALLDRHLPADGDGD
jgi:nitrile hydratase subunit beta